MSIQPHGTTGKLTRLVERGAIFYKAGVPDGKGDDCARRSLANVCSWEPGFKDKEIDQEGEQGRCMQGEVDCERETY